MSLALHCRQVIPFNWFYIINLHNLYFELYVVIEQTQIAQFFWINYVYNGDGIKPSCKLGRI